MERYGLPLPTVPPVPDKLADATRHAQLLRDLEESEAQVLVLLGGGPIRWFLSHWLPSHTRLRDFGPYGQLQACRIGHEEITVLPLAHPRQIAGLGLHSRERFKLHSRWQETVAPDLLKG